MKHEVLTIPQGLLKCRAVSPIAKLIWALIASNPTSPVSTREFADKIGVSKNSAISAIKQLETLKLIKVKRPSHRKRFEKHCNVYHIQQHKWYEDE